MASSSAGEQPVTFEQWQASHGRLFGLCTAQHAETIVAIAKVMRAGGYTPAQLYEASLWLALNDPPTYPNEHLPKLLARLRANAQTSLRSNREAIARQRRTQDRETALPGEVIRAMLAEARAKGVIPCT